MRVPDWRWTVLVVGLALALLFGGQGLLGDMAAGGGRVAVTEPPRAAGCDNAATWQSDWRPEVQGADVTLAETYTCDGFRVHLHVSQYLSQSEGREAVNFNNRYVVGDWRARARPWPGVLTIAGVPVSGIQRERGDTRWVLWNWYCVNDQVAAGPMDAKLLEVVNSIRLRRSSTCLVAVAVDFGRNRPVEAVATTAVISLWERFSEQWNGTDAAGRI